MQFKNLRSIREDKDIKQKDIAQYLNVSQNTYSQYETGVISLTAEVLIKLSDYYDVSIDFLLDRTNNPKKQKWVVNFTTHFLKFWTLYLFSPINLTKEFFCSIDSKLRVGTI